MKKLIILSLLFGTLLSVPFLMLHFRYISAFMGCNVGFETWEGACAADSAFSPYAFFPLSLYLFFLVFSLGEVFSFLPSVLLMPLIFVLFALPFWIVIFLAGLAWQRIKPKPHG